MFDEYNFFWNVYIPVNAMEKMEREFYIKLYNYRAYCIKQTNRNNTNFREDANFIKMLDELNYAYEKIHNLAGVQKNDNGEYDYPKVAYKNKKITQNGKDVIVLFVCIADTTMNRRINLKDIFNYLPLYHCGTMRVVDVPNRVERVHIESSIHDIYSFFKENYNELGVACHLESCKELIEWLGKFPTNSIAELNFNSLISKLELDVCINEALEYIKDAKKGA